MIDDDPYLALATRRGLKLHEVTTETDPTRAIDRVIAAESEDTPFDVVLCDVVMPAMSGLEVIAALRARPEPPILLLMSGHDDVDARLADGVLVKPFRPHEVIQTIAVAKNLRSHAVTRRLPCGPALAV